MLYLVTGTSGFIGGRLAFSLANNGNKVLAPNRKNSKPFLDHSNISTCNYIDLLNNNLVSQCSGIYHCASVTVTNVKGTSNNYFDNIELITIISKVISIAKPDFVVFTSSVSIYGLISTKQLYFDNPIQSVNQYGATKLESEKILKEISEKNATSCYIFRLPGIVGYGSTGNLISRIINTLSNPNNDLTISLTNPNSLFNNIVDIQTLLSYFENIRVNPKYSSAYINTLLCSTNACKFSDIPILISKFLMKSENLGRLSWLKKKTPSFTIDSSCQIKHGFIPETTENSIKKACIDILSFGNHKMDKNHKST